MLVGTLQADNAISGGQLCAEILAATGADVSLSYGFEPPRTVRVVGFDDYTAVILQAIATHVPNPAVVLAAVAAQQENAAATSDLATNYQAALTRCDDILTNGSAYTATQVRAALVDNTRILRRVLRLLKATET